MKIKPAPSPSFETQVCHAGDRQWSVARLAQLSAHLPVMDIPLAHLNLSDEMGPYTVREMAGHVAAIKTADLSYPIILCADGCILDGRHRVCRCIIEGKKTIKAVRFETTPEPCKWINDE